MKKTVYVVLFLTAFVCLSCSSEKSRQEIEQNIRNVESGLVAMELPSFAQQFQTDHLNTPEKASLVERMSQYGVPGVSIALINEYKIEWTKGYGVVNVETGTPVTPETYFEAASTTKFLTAAIALRYVEQGKLDLDDDVNKRLKSWKVPENEFTHDEKVTLRRILTHRSGLSRPDGGYREEEGSTPTLLQVLKGEPPALNQPAVVVYVPGSDHQYSNIGYDVVQLLLEDVSGKSYKQIARETVFDPLKMKSSTLEFPLKPGVAEKTIKPHDEEGNVYENGLHPTALAHGGLVTTPNDLALLAAELMRAYQGKSDRLLSSDMARRMLGVECDIDPNVWFGMNGEGLGVFLLGAGEDRYFMYAGYNNPGATCLMVGSPSTGKGAVIMTNSASGLQLSLELLASIVNEYAWPRLN